MKKDSEKLAEALFVVVKKIEERERDAWKTVGILLIRGDRTTEFLQHADASAQDISKLVVDSDKWLSDAWKNGFGEGGSSGGSSFGSITDEILKESQVSARFGARFGGVGQQLQSDDDDVRDSNTDEIVKESQTAQFGHVSALFGGVGGHVSALFGGVGQQLLSDDVRDDVHEREKAIGDKRVVFVKSQMAMSHGSLETHFTRYGEIDKIILKWKADKSYAYGFIYFKTGASAEQAIRGGGELTVGNVKIQARMCRADPKKN